MSTVQPTVDSIEGLEATNAAIPTINDVQALIWCRWALSDISFHTADTAVANFMGDGITRAFTVQGEVIDTLDKTALVLLSESNQKINVLPPYKFTEDTLIGTNPGSKSFWEWPTNTLNLGFTMSPTQAISVSYYKPWDNPTDDESVLGIPRWMEAPLAYYIVRYYCTAYTIEYSKIRQWNVKTDSGNPLQNPMFALEKHLSETAQTLLSRQPVQDRNRYFTFAGRENNGR